MSIEFPGRSLLGELVVRYRGDEGVDDFSVFLLSSSNVPNPPVARNEVTEGFVWTGYWACYPLNIFVKVGVLFTVLRPSAQRMLMCLTQEAEVVTEKVSLLDETRATGDLNLICKVKKARSRRHTSF